jgi:ArsR family transcriptional regulator
MDTNGAISALGALAQLSRLAVFRLLVTRGPDGLPAGEIARRLGAPHNTMSAHLGVLARAGLVRSRRQGRSIIYAADFAGLRALLRFLMEDCCKARAEQCAPLLDAVLPDPCESKETCDEVPAR